MKVSARLAAILSVVTLCGFLTGIRRRWWRKRHSHRTQHYHNEPAGWNGWNGL